MLPRRSLAPLQEMEAATEMSTPCCCFRNKGALQRGLAPAGTAGIGVGGGTQHRLFHRGNQGPSLEKAKQIFPNKNRSRERTPFTVECFIFAVISSCSPPPTISLFNLCHSQQPSSPAKRRGPTTPPHCVQALLPSHS